MDDGVCVYSEPRKTVRCAAYFSRYILLFRRRCGGTNPNVEKKQADCRFEGRRCMCILRVAKNGEMRSLFFTLSSVKVRLNYNFAHIIFILYIVKARINEIVIIIRAMLFCIRILSVLPFILFIIFLLFNGQNIIIERLTSVFYRNIEIFIFFFKFFR